MTNRRSFGLGGNDEEAKRDPKRPMVVGIGDVRKALKQNIEIKTYQEHSSVQSNASVTGFGKKGSSKKLGNADPAFVEKQLRNMEKNIENKLKA